jgi:hypothetical protein
MKNAVYWVVAPCRYCVNQRFFEIVFVLKYEICQENSTAEIALSFKAKECKQNLK